MQGDPGAADGSAAAPTPSTPATPTGEDRTQEVVVVTGLSGGGKTAAAKLFEDLGYVVVDNLPGELLPDLADLLASDPRRFARTAIVLDVRAGDVPLAFGAMRGALEGRGIRPVIIFLEARDDVLIRRFSETRHRHPLADERGIAASIEQERGLLDSGARRRRRGARHERAVAARAPRAHLRPPGRRPELRPARGPADQLRVQVRGAARGRPRARRPVHAQPVLHRGPADVLRPDRGRPPVRPQPADRRSRSWPSSTTSSTCSSRRTSRRARRG